jgi:CheY-like chemotaxis protein
VAKILVADDNSNVQKTVALALAELNVDVVAVNNGDAAIRKFADFSPDLVLADIFMPVRNGYEVCEYVKKESNHTNVPVVLLVGAFDPLDEREAQRVGADGILKKPFVPPDPLITMVKSLLDRSLTERLVGVSVAKPAAPAPQKAGGTAVAEVHSPAPEKFEEEPAEELQPPTSRISFGQGEAPIAFGQLLDVPVPVQNSAPPEAAIVEPVDDDQVLTHSRDATLGEPVFWKSDEPETEATDENAEGDAEVHTSAWHPGDDPLPGQGGHELVQPEEPLELVREEQEEQIERASTIVEPGASILQDPASQSPLTVASGPPEDLAVSPLDWMASAPPQTSDAVSETTAPDPDLVSDLIHELEPMNASPVTTASVPNSAVSVGPFEPPAPASQQPKPDPTIAVETPATHKSEPSLKPPAQGPAVQGPEDTAPSLPHADWADMGADFPPKPAAPAPETAKPAPELKVPTLNPPAAIPAPTEIASSPFDSPDRMSIPQPRRDWADLATGLPAKSAAPVQQNLKPAPDLKPPTPNPAEVSQSAPANAAIPPPPDPALVEAIVQRVLEKMKPQVVDIITKEFLRPVVQALVHREIEKR